MAASFFKNENKKNDLSPGNGKKVIFWNWSIFFN